MNNKNVGVRFIEPAGSIPKETKKDLPEIVRTFKALVTRNTRLKFWQRNYYEHVIM